MCYFQRKIFNTMKLLELSYWIKIIIIIIIMKKWVF